METQMLLYLKQAQAAMHNAYTPYSHFRVGACLVCEDGSVYTGCNIENSAFSPTNCAERTAFFKAVSEGERKFRAICIIGGKDISETVCTPPCGVCRQVMAEFCDPKKFKVILASGREKYRILRLEELLPFGFGSEYL